MQLTWVGGRRPLWALPADTDLSVVETFPRPTLIGGHIWRLDCIQMGVVFLESA